MKKIKSVESVLHSVMHIISAGYKNNGLDLWNIAFCNRDRIQVIMIFQDKPEFKDDSEVDELFKKTINC